MRTSLCQSTAMPVSDLHHPDKACNVSRPSLLPILFLTVTNEPGGRFYDITTFIPVHDRSVAAYDRHVYSADLDAVAAVRVGRALKVGGLGRRRRARVVAERDARPDVEARGVAVAGFVVVALFFFSSSVLPLLVHS